MAAALREIAKRLELAGQSPYKVRAYERGARSLESLAADLAVTIAEGRLTRIPGIGERLAATIEELARTGTTRQLEELRASMPPGVLDLARVPRLTPAKIAALHRALGVDTVAELRQACVEGRVRSVKGFGEKTERALLAAIDALDQGGTAKTLLHEALADGEGLRAQVEALGPVTAAVLAGAARRRVETVERLVVVATTTRPAEALDAFAALPAVAAVAHRDAVRCLVRRASGPPAELVVAAPGEAGAALLRATGTDEHLTELERIAEARKIAFEGHTLRRGRRALRAATEADVYRALEVPELPPEAREGVGELQALARGELRLPLVDASDVRGLVHCHTVYSDGRHTVEEMARAADALGVEYLTITDHSPTASYAGGLTLDRLHRQWDEIARVQESVRVRLLRGTESDILRDGSLDYPDHVLEQLDVVVASVHERHRMSEDEMTRRVVAAMRRPVFKIWGHALGRYVERRPPFACRMDEVFDAIAESPAAIEVNGDPHRLDLEPRWIREARKRGIPFVLSTDAHSTGALRNVRFAVAMARRGWLTAAEVLNTRPADAFAAAVRPAR